MGRGKRMKLGVCEAVAIAGTLMAATAAAAPYRFEATVTAEVELATAVVELSVDLGEWRTLLKADLSEGELQAEVVDRETGEGMAAVMWSEASGKALIGWPMKRAMRTGEIRRFRITLRESPEAVAPATRAGVNVERHGQRIVVSTGAIRITHDLNRGGMISRIEYGKPPGRTLELSMNDRVYQKGEGGFYLRQDPEPTVRVIRLGGIMATIRVESRYMNAGRWPESRPRACYEFAYRPGSPFVDVSAGFSQESPRYWEQLHFLEIHHTQDCFTHWSSGDPLDSGVLTHPSRTYSLRGKAWGAMFNDLDALGLVGSSLYGIHDGLGQYGIYVHGPWVNRISEAAHFAARLYVGPSGGSPEALAKLIREPAQRYSVSLRFPEVEQRNTHVAARLRGFEERRPKKAGPELTNRLRVARLLLAEAQDYASVPGRLRDWSSALAGAESLLAQVEGLGREGQFFDGAGEPAAMLFAGDTFLRVKQEGGCVWLSHLGDLNSRLTLVTQGRCAALWEARFRHRETGEVIRVIPQVNWADGRQRVILKSDLNGGGMRICWEHCDLPGDPGAVDVIVTVRAQADAPLFRWRISVLSRSELWGLWEVDFPRIKGIVADLQSRLVVPRKWGTRYDDPVAGRGFVGCYPSAAMNMQFVSCTLDNTGLYLAAHDPAARIKTIAIRPDGFGKLSYALTSYPDDMGIPGRDYEMPFDAVVAVHSGGWYEAARIYRAWVTKHAPWCAGGPLITREDVPQWFKDCALCFRPGGDPRRVMPILRKLHAAFQMPAVVHWYSWHRIPFDNDYPEYFPTKPGFGEAVAEAQKLGLRIMPYINGRLWDSDTKSWADEHADRGVAVNAEGKPYIEHWSKQNHGVMCPFTRLWQEKMREIAARVADECGCKGLYLDQIGAARGRLCFAANHGHGMGGAKSWVAGEQQLLAGVRQAGRAAQPDFIMTTEDNAEPYMAQLDGYLMCNAEGPGMVPLFPAVYGGYTLTFGRSGQLDDDAVFAMQHGQAFTFGSMMARISSDAITKPEHAEKLDFLKRLARMRYEYRDFLALGEMLRAPKLAGEIPMLKGEFKSKHKGFVQMSALLSAAWRAPDRRIGLFFVNISREPVPDVTLEFDGTEYGLAGEVEVVELSDDGKASATVIEPAGFSRTLDVRPWHAGVVVVRERQQ